MLDALTWLFGEGEDLASWQMAARAVAMFFIALVLIRVSGRRSFGQGNAFDACMTVMVGAVLSRAVAGVSPFWPTVCAGAALAAVHRLVAILSWKWGGFDRLVSGTSRELMRDGQVDPRAMRKSLIADRDLTDAIRQQTGSTDRSHVQRAYLQRDGKIIVVKRERG